MSSDKLATSPEKTEAEKVADQIEAIEKRRKDRATAADTAANTQRLIDLTAIDELEIELGESNLAKVEIPHTPGCVTIVAAKTPSSPQIKRYRFRVREGGVKHDQIPDTTAAAEELAEACLCYPAKGEGGKSPDFEKVCAARPGLKAQLGHMTAALVVGDVKK